MTHPMKQQSKIGGETSQERQRREQGEPARDPSKADQDNDPGYPARRQPEGSQTEHTERPSGESASVRNEADKTPGRDETPA